MSKFWNILRSAFTPPVSPVKEVETEEKAFTERSDSTIVLHCKKKDIELMESLSRYLESPITGVLSKGVWLLTLARDAQVQDKHLAIVEIDEESGQVKSVSPIGI